MGAIRAGWVGGGGEGGRTLDPPPPGNLATAVVCILLPCNNT